MGNFCRAMNDDMELCDKIKVGDILDCRRGKEIRIILQFLRIPGDYVSWVSWMDDEGHVVMNYRFPNSDLEAFWRLF